MKSSAFIIILLCVVVFSCKKNTTPVIQPIYVKLDVPFNMAMKDTCVLLDSVTNSNTGQKTVNKVKVYITAIIDNREFGVTCMSGTGGNAKIEPDMELNDTANITGLQYMPGCTNGGEYDTINSNIPTCILDHYVLYLLRLNPYDSLPKNQSGYTIDYIIGKK